MKVTMNEGFLRSGSKSLVSRRISGTAMFLTLCVGLWSARAFLFHVLD